MLSHVPMPSFSSVDLYKSMISNAQGTDFSVLSAFEPQAQTAYTAYDGNLGSSQNVSPLTPFNPDLKKVLLECYGRLNNKGITPSYARDVMLNAIPLCPYCGISETAELDHVLPRSVWPEFTIHVSNLVPACGKCNVKKSTRSYRSTGWSYRHPYFDPNLVQKFLSVKPNIRNKNVQYVFSVIQPAGVSSAEFKSVKESFDTFKLARRFANRSVLHISDRSKKLRDTFSDSGQKGVKEYLASEGDSVVAAKNINHWEAVLMCDLANYPSFCSLGTWQ